MIDFDKLFSDYAIEWHKANSDKFSPAEIENMVADLYSKWADTFCAEIKCTPREYFASFTDSASLVNLLAEYCRCTISPPSILMDEVVSRDDCVPFLLDEIRAASFDEFTIVCANLLLERGNESVHNLVLDWIFDSGVDDEFRELAAEIVQEVALEDFSALLNGMEDCDDKGLMLAIDILVGLPYNERVYQKLVELFVNGDNIPLYASYLGKYGNPNSIKLLLGYAEDCNYLEYLEIRNAVEMLGGEFNVSRDFSEDEYYHALKGTGN